MNLLRKLTAPTLMTTLLLVSPASLAQNTAIDWAWILFGGWFLKLHDINLQGIGGKDTELEVEATFLLNGYCINPKKHQVTGTSALSSAEVTVPLDGSYTIDENGKVTISVVHYDPDSIYERLGCPNGNWTLLNEDPDVDCEVNTIGTFEDCHPDRTSVYASRIYLTLRTIANGKVKGEVSRECTLENPVYTTAGIYDSPFYLDDGVTGKLADEVTGTGEVVGTVGEPITIYEDFVLVQGSPDPNSPNFNINKYDCP